MIKRIIKFFNELVERIKGIYNLEPMNDFNNELLGWLLWIWEQDTDYIFGAEVDLEQELTKRWLINRQVVYEYNQWAQYKTRCRCAIYSAVTEVSRLMNYKFSQSEIEEIWDLMIKDWVLDPDYWTHLQKAIDYVRRWWNNKYPDRLIESYQIKYSDKELRRILTHVNPRLTQLWYRTSTELFQEIQTTWVANKKTYKRNWGHAVSQWWLTTINNYFGKIFNWWRKFRNRFSFTHIDDLVKNKVIYEIWYMFLKKMD